MQDRLAQIRESNPQLDEVETYNALVDALTPEVMDEQYDLLENAMKQYHDMLQKHMADSKDRSLLLSAKENPCEFADLFEKVVYDHDCMDDFFREISDLADAFTDKVRFSFIVEDKIQEQWPEFYRQYQEKVKWNEIRKAQLTHHEEAKLNGPSGNSTERPDPGQTR